jgi:hypothetical protein
MLPFFANHYLATFPVFSFFVKPDDSAVFPAGLHPFIEHIFVQKATQPSRVGWQMEY